jgi:ferredoxin
MTESTTQKGLKFSIDTNICSGHGRCYTLAPQWFDADDVGYGEVKDGVIDEGQRAAMEDIAAACPEGAISVEEVSAG